MDSWMEGSVPLSQTTRSTPMRAMFCSRGTRRRRSARTTCHQRTFVSNLTDFFLAHLEHPSTGDILVVLAEAAMTPHLLEECNDGVSTWGRHRSIRKPRPGFAGRQVLKPGTSERCRNGIGEGLIVTILLWPASPIELPLAAIKSDETQNPLPSPHLILPSPLSIQRAASGC